MGAGANRAAISACVIRTVIMQALDTTIANVALPYIPGPRVSQRGPDQLGADLLHRRRTRSAMALFGVSVMVGPVLGPVIGGWLTDNMSWRRAIYINLPIGILALAGSPVFVAESGRDLRARLDWLGFGTLSLAVAALQPCRRC